MARSAAALDPRIVRLASTTFCGQRLRRSQIADIQEIVTSLPLLSRTELGHTVCEHLRWQTPRGLPMPQIPHLTTVGWLWHV